MNRNFDTISQKERILMAAYDYISSEGYANASLREIASNAGVALSQLNYYFKNKEGLLIEVIQIMIDKYLLEVEERLKRGINAKERVSNFIKYFQETLSENPKLFRLLYDFSSMALWSDVFGKQLSNLFEKLSILVEEYIFIDTPEDSFLKNQSSNAIARILFGTMFGTAIQVLLDPKEKRLPESLSAIETLF